MQRLGSLELDDLLSLALVMVFFKAGRRDLLAALAGRLAGVQAAQLSPKNVDFLHKLLLLGEVRAVLGCGWVLG
jgi:hypothetical protein